MKFVDCTDISTGERILLNLHAIKTIRKSKFSGVDDLLEDYNGKKYTCRGYSADPAPWDGACLENSIVEM